MGTKRKPTSDRTEQCALMHANKKLQNQTARLSAGQSDTIATPAAPAAVAAPPPHIVREVRSLVPNLQNTIDDQQNELVKVNALLAESEVKRQESVDASQGVRAQLSRMTYRLTASEKLASKTAPAASLLQKAKAKLGSFATSTTGFKVNTMKDWTSKLNNKIKGMFFSNKAKHTAMVNLMATKEYREVLVDALKLSGLEKELYQDAVERVQDFWAVERGLVIKEGLSISDRKYQFLINNLSADWVDDEEGKRHVPHQLIEGVDMPSLGKNASKNAVLARAEELFIDTNPGHSRCSPQRRVGEPTWPRLQMTGQSSHTPR